MSVNNDVYHTLGERWYTAKDDPIALLRAENRMRAPLISRALTEQLGKSPNEVRVLDVGCGGGFLSNTLAQQGFQVVGVDQSESSLAVARAHDPTGVVDYRLGNALKLDFPDASFDAVTVMDFLEHVSDYSGVIREISRVLVPGGLWFFHTFNRTRASDWIAIRAVEHFVANVPDKLHLHSWFITPRELEAAAKGSGLSVLKWVGMRPALDPHGLWDLLTLARTGCVPAEFRFVASRSLAVGYFGWGRKEVDFGSGDGSGAPKRGA